MSSTQSAFGMVDSAQVQAHLSFLVQSQCPSKPDEFWLLLKRPDSSLPIYEKICLLQQVCVGVMWPGPLPTMYLETKNTSQAIHSDRINDLKIEFGQQIKNQ